MSKRTYKEAVELTVNWWIEKSFKTLLNQNNGDNSPSGEIGFMLMNMVSMSARDKNTPDKVDKFKIELTRLLLEVEGRYQYGGEWFKL